MRSCMFWPATCGTWRRPWSASGLVPTSNAPKASSCYRTSSTGCGPNRWLRCEMTLVTLDISVNQQRLVQAFPRFSSRACAKTNERPGGQDILGGFFADAIRTGGPWATTVDCLAAALESVTVVFTLERQRCRAAAASGDRRQQRAAGTRVAQAGASPHPSPMRCAHDEPTTPPRGSL